MAAPVPMTLLAADPAVSVVKHLHSVPARMRGPTVPGPALDFWRSLACRAVWAARRRNAGNKIREGSGQAKFCG